MNIARFLPKRRNRPADKVRPRRKDSGSKLYEMLKLVLGFFLTGVVGTVITQFYKERETQEQIERESIKAASGIFLDIIDTCDKRHYYALRLWAAYQKYKPQPELDAAFKKYDDIIVYWNETRIRNQALLNTYFGAEIEDELTGTIIGEFHEVHSGLMDIRRIYEEEHRFSDDSEEVKSKIDKLDDTLTDFSAHMQKSLALRQQPKPRGLDLFSRWWNTLSQKAPSDQKQQPAL